MAKRTQEIYDGKDIAITFAGGPTSLYLSGDWHIGKTANHAADALERFVTDFNADKTANKALVITGDLLEGHLDQHHYQNALERIEPDGKPAKTVSHQLLDFWDVMRRLEYEPNRTVLIMGNHDESAFREMGDAFGILMRSSFGEDFPHYPGFEADIRMRWPDGATFNLLTCHGGRTVGGAATSRWWDQAIIDTRASRNLAATLIGMDGTYPLHDGYAMGHTHRLIEYSPRWTKRGFRSDWGDPLWAWNTGSFYRSGVCPWGDYQRRGMGKPYDVGYVKVTFGKDSHKIVEGKTARKVRTPRTVELRDCDTGRGGA